MKGKRILSTGLAIAVMLALLAGLALAQQPAGSPLTAAFTYQGRLNSSGIPYTGPCDFQFGLWDALSGGAQVGPTQTLTNVPLTDGYFTVLLDWGADKFFGEQRWLEIYVRCPAGSGAYTPLTPRQQLTVSPQASFAMNAPWPGLLGVPPGFADGVDNDTIYTAGMGLVLTDTIFSADTSVMQRRVIGACGAGSAIREVNQDGSVTCEPVGGGGGSAWLLTGNSGTTPGTDYVGTSDNVALELRVNGQRALRLEPTDTSPNLIGGRPGNWLTSGVYGATIGGGGVAGDLNRVTDSFGTVGGGAGNQAGNDAGTTDDAAYATVGGGWSNTAARTSATVGGGWYNTADGADTTVGGGSNNIASGWGDTVAGGYQNTAGGNHATVGGGWSNTASHPNATVGGGYYNTASGDNATVGGGSQNAASGQWATVGGGLTNTATADFSTIGGGLGNTGSGYGTVGGGYVNTAGWGSTAAGGTWNTASGQYAAIGGGEHNTASGYHATVSGGYTNTASYDQSTVGGGWGNTASGVFATVGGGYTNSASWTGTTIGGGEWNTANTLWATVAGGYHNTASGYNATVAGGEENTASGNNATVGGGTTNTASGFESTIAGGQENTAGGIASTVPGGLLNSASGNYSFAAGRRAKAYYDGCFVWGDSTDDNLSCAVVDRWLARASGGVYFYTNSTLTTYAYLAAGSGSWASGSDRNLKENVAEVDSKQLLARLAQVPVTTWNYTSQDDSIRHIGPMAQDFYAAFGVGEDDTHITTIDADGVALAAIQGLYAENQELKAQVGDLEARLAALEKAQAPARTGAALPWLLIGGVVVAGGTLAARRRPGGGR